MNKGDIAVIIAAYSRQHTLFQALRSLKNQSLLPSEIVVVDDGSPVPLTLGLARQWFPRVVRLTLIRSEHNGGTASARNIGVMASEAPKICFMDHDDLAVRHKLRVQDEMISNGADMALHHGRSFVTVGPALKPTVFGAPYVMNAAFMIPRDVFRDLGMLRPIQGGDDTEILMRAQKNGLNIRIANDVLIHRRIGSENLSLRIDRRLTMLQALKSVLGSS